MDRITETLVNARKEHGISQRELGRILGLAQSTMAGIERGARKLPEKYYEDLPPAVLIPVLKVVIREYERRLESLNDLLAGAEDP